MSLLVWFSAHIYCRASVNVPDPLFLLVLSVAYDLMLMMLM